MGKILIPILTVALLPAAVLLLIIGVRAVRPDKRSGIGLKLALIVNTSLAVVLGWFGCAKAEQPEVLCYTPVAIPDERVPEAFGESDAWNDLEKTVVELEMKINSSDFDDGKYDEFRERIGKAKLDLAEEGLLNADEQDVIGAYCSERLAWYLHMIGGATCYEPMPIPTGREATLGNIVARGMELRELYAQSTLGGETYDAAVAALEDELREYTGDEDVSSLRQLILDLADGVKYD
ncbi:MAG: hypothetical protein JSW52_00680 [Candidatus Coatesbacteria bacterium]|nr:MAG: hypothetical protein JSW52_00680 [Candidatus Coatesbacteria bacterium]